MAGKQIDPQKVAHFVALIGKGISKNAASKESGISWATVMRQLNDPMSAIITALAEAGLAAGAVPGRETYSKDALRALDDFGFFREYFFARSTSPWAEEAAYKMLELAATDQEEYVVVNIAPGVGKSTMFTHDFPAWRACRDRTLSQMIGSASQNLANGYTNRLRNTFERTTPVRANAKLLEQGRAKDAKSTLARSYGRFRPLDQGQWSRNAFDLAQLDGSKRGEKESSFVAYGMDSDYLGGRFDQAIWDDLVTNKTIATEEARIRLENKWESESETRLEPEGLLILQGQRLGPKDLYRYCLDLKEFTEIDLPDEETQRKYHHITFKAHYDEKCEGDHGLDAKPYPQGCLLDPYRLNWRKLMNAKLNREDNYRTVYQQEDVDAGNSLVKLAWIDGGTDLETNTFSPGCYDKDRSAGVIDAELAKIQAYSVVCCDPSPTKYWSIQWFLYDPETQFQHLIDLERRPMDAPDFLDYDLTDNKFTGLLEEWWLRSSEAGRPFTTLIFEENAAQRWLTQFAHFQRWSQFRGVELVKHQTLKNKTDPAYGVQALAPEYRFGRIRLPGNVADGSKRKVAPLVKEVTQYPNGTTDDCVMAHWFLIWNAPRIFLSFKQGVYQQARPSWMQGRGSRSA